MTIAGTVLFLVIFAIILFSVILHEVAHAWTALKFGDSTAYCHGRVTLNPLAHIDLFGTILFPILSFILTGMIFGWAKPVPVDFNNLRPRKLGIFCVSVAGIATNLFIALICGLTLRITGLFDLPYLPIFEVVSWLFLLLSGSGLENFI